ncbi:artemin-like [Osmerus eperlanus]|uniref:artemin-like n=1 Tax=Osmerus eperlanus TaxID=29151 RepID=UPI002E160ADA
MIFRNPYVLEEQESHPGGHRSARLPQSFPPSPATPAEPPKKKKKRKQNEKAREGVGKEREKGKGKGKKGSPRQSSRDCHLEKREMRVRDLGLGFDSDEIVLFKFCVGSCRASRTNYDLALRALLENGSLPRRTVRKVTSQPCCRPHKYEPVSFMDAHTTWRTIESLSAASCMCMG